MKQEISYEDYYKVEIKVGTVLSVSKKILKILIILFIIKRISIRILLS